MMKKNPIALGIAITMLLTGCAGTKTVSPAATEAGSTVSINTSALTDATTTVLTTSANNIQPDTIQYMSRPDLLSSYSPVEVCAKPAQKYLTANADLSNVDFNGYRFTRTEKDGFTAVLEVDWVTKGQEELLKKNGFYVDPNLSPA